MYESGSCQLQGILGTRAIRSAGKSCYCIKSGGRLGATHMVSSALFAKHADLPTAKLKDEGGIWRAHDGKGGIAGPPKAPSYG
jgi:hypothetical protein